MKLHDTGLSERELDALDKLVDIAKDLVEYDLMCTELKEMKKEGKYVDKWDTKLKDDEVDASTE